MGQAETWHLCDIPIVHNLNHEEITDKNQETVYKITAL